MAGGDVSRGLRKIEKTNKRERAAESGRVPLGKTGWTGRWAALLWGFLERQSMK